MFTIPNQTTIDGAVFHDAESHPVEQLSSTQVLAQSSNLGTIQIAQRLGAQALASQITNLGYGVPTGLNFPGSSAGIVRPVSSWSPTAIGSTPIGQDDAVTAQQILDVTNTVADGGTFISPRLLQGTVSVNDNVLPVKQVRGRRVMSTTVASELTTMMEAVIQNGTAVAAGIPGYSVAGKTGTAQIPSAKGGYIPGAFMATFTGFAPAENPALSAVVVLNQPTPIYGGTVAAPVFSEFMQYALQRYGIPTSPNGGVTGGTAQAIPFVVTSPATGTTGTTGGGTSTSTIGGVGSATEGP